MAMQLIRGGTGDHDKTPCTRCRGAGCGECCEIGTKEAQERARQEAAYYAQIVGMPDAQLIDCAIYEAAQFTRQFGSFQAWYVTALLEEVLLRKDLEESSQADG